MKLAINGDSIIKGELAETKSKLNMPKTKEIIEYAKNFSNGTALTIINEAIQNAQSTDERVELLTFKSTILESALFGETFTI